MIFSELTYAGQLSLKNLAIMWLMVIAQEVLIPWIQLSAVKNTLSQLIKDLFQVWHTQAVVDF